MGYAITAGIAGILIVIIVSLIIYIIVKPEKKKTNRWLVIIIVLGVLLAIDIPFLINESYKFGSGYITVWNGSDMLSFYGTCLGAVATITAVILTINNIEKSRKRDILIEIKKQKVEDDYKRSKLSLDKIKQMIDFEHALNAHEHIVTFLQSARQIDTYVAELICYFENNAIINNKLQYIKQKIELTDGVLRVNIKMSTNDLTDDYSTYNILEQLNTHLKAESVSRILNELQCDNELKADVEHIEKQIELLKTDRINSIYMNIESRIS